LARLDQLDNRDLPALLAHRVSLGQLDSQAVLAELVTQVIKCVLLWPCLVTEELPCNSVNFAHDALFVCTLECCICLPGSPWW